MTDHLVDQLRATDPAADLDRDPHGPTGRRIRAQARDSGQRAIALDTAPRRGKVIVAVAALMALSGAGALASGVFDPDPADVAAILEDAEDRTTVHLDGWRPELTSEAIVCAYAPGAVTVTSASEFPLNEPLTPQAVTTQCVEGTDAVRSGEVDPPQHTTLCGGTLHRDAVAERLASLDAQVLAGSLDGNRHRFPVVLGWEADCAEVNLEGWSPMDLNPLDTLDEINTARAVEVRLKAAALEHCLSREQAEELARQAHQQLGPGWLLIDEANPRASCHEIWVESEEGWLTIVGQT